MLWRASVSSSQLDHRPSPASSVSLVALLEPWVAVVVVAVALPESGLVVAASASALAPIWRSSRSTGAVPAAVPARRARARARSPPYSYATQAGRRSGPQVPGSSCSRRRTRRSRTRRRSRRLRAACRPIPPPARVELRPLRHAMDVDRERLRRERKELLPGPGHRLATAPWIVKLHSSSGVCGVGPADSTGKSTVTYWPGGTREDRRPDDADPKATGDRRHQAISLFSAGRAAQGNSFSTPGRR